MVANLADIPLPAIGEEYFQTLFQQNRTKIEVIVSDLKTPGEMYDQNEDEWIILLEGNAILEVDGEIVALKKGDYLLLSAHTFHRVLETSEYAKWLCVFSS